MRIAIVGAIAASLILAIPAPARADIDPDVDFCQTLARMGYIGNCVTLDSYGHGVCAQFDQGNDWSSILTMLDNNFTDRKESAAVLVAATKILCPWNESKKP